MKTAIIHDSYLHYGGAEKVLHILLKNFPSADVYIPLIKPEFATAIKKKHNLYTSKLLNKIPLLIKLQSYLKPLVFLYWKQLDLSEYDTVISSSHSFSSKSVTTSKNTFHVSYIHTPPKYLYSEFNKTQWINHPLAKIILQPIMNLLRLYDFRSAQKPDMILCNSKNVRNRIKKYYNRYGKVVYPIAKKKYDNIKRDKPSKNYFLFLSRLETQKGVELVIKTCSKHNIPLIVVGTGSLSNKLQKIAGKSVKFTGFVHERGKQRLISEAKALIYAAVDEDFGIVIDEVLSKGVPVIAFDSGAINEFNSTNIHSFSEFTQKSLYKKIQQLS